MAFRNKISELGSGSSFKIIFAISPLENHTFREDDVIIFTINT